MEQTKYRWAQYFEELLNYTIPSKLIEGAKIIHAPAPQPTFEEVNYPLETVRDNKAQGADRIPVQLLLEYQRLIIYSQRSRYRGSAGNIVLVKLDEAVRREE